MINFWSMFRSFFKKADQLNNFFEDMHLDSDSKDAYLLLARSGLTIIEHFSFEPEHSLNPEEGFIEIFNPPSTRFFEGNKFWMIGHDIEIVDREYWCSSESGTICCAYGCSGGSAQYLDVLHLTIKELLTNDCNKPVHLHRAISEPG